MNDGPLHSVVKPPFSPWYEQLTELWGLERGERQAATGGRREGGRQQRKEGGRGAGSNGRKEGGRQAATEGRREGGKQQRKEGGREAGTRLHLTYRYLGEHLLVHVPLHSCPCPPLPSTRSSNTLKVPPLDLDSNIRTLPSANIR